MDTFTKACVFILIAMALGHFGIISFAGVIILTVVIIVAACLAPLFESKDKTLCPVCSKTVSRNAVSCPHCGEPIKKETN